MGLHRRSAAGFADLRQVIGAELNDDNRLMMYVPRGFAHEILTLSDDTEALYLQKWLWAV